MSPHWNRDFELHRPPKMWIIQTLYLTLQQLIEVVNARLWGDSNLPGFCWSQRLARTKGRVRTCQVIDIVTSAYDASQVLVPSSAMVGTNFQTPKHKDTWRHASDEDVFRTCVTHLSVTRSHDKHNNGSSKESSQHCESHQPTESRCPSAWLNTWRTSWE